MCNCYVFNSAVQNFYLLCWRDSDLFRLQSDVKYPKHRLCLRWQALGTYRNILKEENS